MFTFDQYRAGTFDARTIDTAGAFLQGELERLDQTLHQPIASVTWSRDIDLRTDVTIADEASSFANLSFASPGGINPTGKAWIGKTSTAIPGIAVDLQKTINPLNLWAMELAYTIPELESSIRVGRPIDTQKYDGLKLKHQMDIDEQVYVGDAGLGVYGLLNNPNVAVSNVTNGAASSPLWANKTPAEILRDVNGLLAAAWAATGYAFVPSKLLLPPLQYGYIVQQINSQAGNSSILTYLQQNSLAMAQNGRPLEIVPVKWLTGRGVGGTDRMVAYTQDPQRIRFPMTTLLNTPIQYKDIHLMTYYYCRLGVVEITNFEFMAYYDGI